jgi:hypothetical protein
MIQLRQGFAVLMLATTMFGATESVSIDTKTKKVQNPIVNFGSGNTLNGTGATIIGFPGSSYTFIDSLTQSAGNVSLVNDSASPGNSKYYGTDSGGVLGFHTVTGGGGTFIGLDFTGNNMTFMNGTTMWKSTADINDSATSTATNTGITQKDVNDVVMFTLWSDGTFGGNVLIVDQLPAGFDFGNAADDVFIGTQTAVNFTSGSSNVAVGNSALNQLINGDGNVAVGQSAGSAVTTGLGNVSLGTNAGQIEATASNTTILGFGALAFTGVTDNAIAIGKEAIVTADNTAVIGNASVTDVYLGSSAALAKVHASNLVGGFTAHFSRGGAAIQTNDVILTPWTCPYSGTITGYSISTNTGTCTLKTWKKANGTAIPTIADVISTSGVSLSTGTHIRSATVTDFTTTTVTAGDMFMAQVTATSGPTDITFQVEITR